MRFMYLSRPDDPRTTRRDVDRRRTTSNLARDEESRRELQRTRLPVDTRGDLVAEN